MTQQDYIDILDDVFLNPFKENTALLIAGLVVAGIAAYFFIDKLVEIVAGIVALLFGWLWAKKETPSPEEILADEHQDMADHAINQAVIKQKQADEVHRATEALSKGIKQRDEPPAPGKTRKRFSAS